MAGDGMAPQTDAPSAAPGGAAPASGAAAAQGTCPPRRRRGRKRTLGTAAAAAVVVAARVAERSAAAGPAAVLGQLRWAWMPTVIMLESSPMPRWLPGRCWPAGVVSAAAGALVMAGGGLASGNVLAAAVTVPGGVLAAAVLVVVAASAWRSGLRGALQRPAAWALRGGSRLARRPVADPGQVIRVWAGRLGELQLSLAGWTMVIVLAVGNWLAGAAVLAVGILSVGGRGALARSAAGLWRGDCRAELLRHPRRARRHRGNA